METRRVKNGSLCVLNVGAGDVRLSFNHHDKSEKAKALRMLKDMIRRGYAVLIQLEDGSYTRAIEVDATRGTYVIQEPDSDVVIDVEREQKALPPATGLDEVPLKKRRGRPPGKRGAQRRHVPIATSHAVGVARSAGG